MKTSYNKQPEQMKESDCMEELKWKQAVDLTDDAETLTDEEAEALSDDEALRQAYRELMECKTAVRKEFGHRAPDAEQEWERFQSRRRPAVSRRRYYWRGVCAGIAATLLVFFAYSWIKQYRLAHEGIQVFTSDSQTQEVILRTADGRQVALTAAPDAAFSVPGASIEQSTDTIGLVYHPDTAPASAETHFLSTPRGQDFKVVLCDGTAVWLNAESILEYPSRFTGPERRVCLHGEAYFDVARNEGQPFVVETPDMTAKVLGTEFNLSAYTGQDTHVTLIDGGVEVTSRKSGQSLRITPGEDALLQADGSFALRQVDIDSYIYWKEGFFFFDNIPLTDIMQSLGRWYNVNVIFANESAMRYRMHYLCDRKGGIEHAVELLNMMQKVKAEFKDNTVYIR